ncbi:DNA-binding MarR family transcriptional regulator [Natronobacillus azotifigens]|uniref:Uncharacterized protein n=1 Tax=Natronobacillus azotifigens TaxID=472978 RepID=A0A9J6RGT5_9BACI|nr:hypothetical protein [Natronobacillus azotifigens]MCZ0704612.1 hypothetical protein [Natronobacillus azotifigens]
MDKLSLLESLALNNNLSKSEMNVAYYCYKQERSSKDIGKYLNWQAPNVARLLLAMNNKGFLNRRMEDDKKSYLYTTNLENELLNIE